MIPNRNRSYQPPKKKKEHRTNEEIRSPQVRVTGDGIQSEVVSIQEAQRMAREMGVDLIEIAPQSNPPVCKIEDYGKFLYKKKKKDEENDSKNKPTQTKELRLTPTTDEHDLAFKTKHAEQWLNTESN